jgi:proteasome lid subunit RPN8/RPN11
MPTSFWGESRFAYQGVPRHATSDGSLREPFGPEVDAAIKAHAVAEYPNECCGIVVDGQYIPCKNVHPEPTVFFEIEPEMIKEYRDVIEGVAHSHTVYMPYPSKEDMEQQDLMDVPWAIATVRWDGDNPPICIDMFWFGDCLGMLPLIGRVFRPGAQDCFALVRDFYREQGYEVPVMPRDPNWWLAEEGRPRQDLFKTWVDGSVFERITFEQAKIGDAFACGIDTSIMCHCGILMPKERVLHHRSNVLSNLEPAHRWIHRALHECGQFFRLKGYKHNDDTAPIREV